MNEDEEINLTVNNVSFDFFLDIDIYNQLQNDIASNSGDVIGASRNFLNRTIKAEQKAALIQILYTVPDAIMSITTAVIEEYKKPLNIIVGKSTSGSKV